jgi:Clp amino terminal domain, pathogenicity island component
VGVGVWWAMFERFTDRARRVLVLAQEEARLLNHNFIGTEHILLGLFQEREGVAAKALGSLGISPEAVRETVEEMAGPTDLSLTGSPPFTPRAKRVLELSLREALQSGHNYIGTEHLLLGLIREGEGVAVQVLVASGVDLEQLRQRVFTIAAGDRPIPNVEAGDPVVSGPRCPHCARRLEGGGVAYKVLKVPRSDREQSTDVADIAFVYCTRCGKVIAHAPFGDLADGEVPQQRLN